MAVTLFLLPWYFAAVGIVFFGVMGVVEYRNLLSQAPGKGLSLPSLILGATLIGGGALLWGGQALHLGLYLAALLLIGRTLLEGAGDRLQALERAGFELFGLVWVPWFLAHVVLVLRLPDGRQWVIYLFWVLIWNDCFAYLVGTLLGRHPLLPAVSPNKTVEGTLGGIAGCLLAALVCDAWIFPSAAAPPPLSHLALLSVGLGLLGQAGDLLESIVKRACGAKDSGVFLPGHGGFLDRMDAFLPTSPLLYYYLVFTVPQG